MENLKEINLTSYKYYYLIYIAVALIILITPVLVFSVISSGDLHIGHVIGFMIYLIYWGGIVYFSKILGKASIKGDKLIIKKVWGARSEFRFDQIGYVKSDKFINSHFTKLEIKKDGEKFEKLLILDSKSIFRIYEMDVENILKLLKEDATFINTLI